MLDTASLLQPISPAQPAGLDLRLAQMTDHPMDKVKKERKQEDPLLLPPGTEPRKINWQAVLDGCKQLMSKHSKDLEAGAYLCEALTRQHGIDGLTKGLEVLGGLVETFWPTLHPGAPSSDDPDINLDIRAKWVLWVGSNPDLLNALGAVPLGITQASGAMLKFGDLSDAKRVQHAYQADPTEYGRLMEAKLTTPDDWSAAIKAASEEAREKVAAAAERCLQGVLQLEAKCAAVFPANEAPTLGKLSSTLETMVGEMRSPSVAEAAANAAAAEAGDGGGGGGSGGGGGGGARGGVAVSGSLQSREDAARTLQSVIKFLRATEPHSPVSYMLERCVRWLGMNFDDLMLDLVKDQNAIGMMREQLGIQPPAQA